jgi:hypothetical protein
MKLQLTKEEQLAADVEQVVALAAEIELARPAVVRLRKLLEVLDDPFARRDAADAMPAASSCPTVSLGVDPVSLRLPSFLESGPIVARSTVRDSEHAVDSEQRRPLSSSEQHRR